MMQKYKDSHICNFVECYPTPVYLQQQDVQVKFNKRESKGEKISLRRVQSRSELVNTQQKSEQNQEKITLNTSPLYTQTVNNNPVTLRIIACHVSPKPRITFAWKTDLERTKKAQNKQQLQSTPHLVDPQLQKTKSVSKTLKIPTNLQLSTYKASFISISDEEQKHTPKSTTSILQFNRKKHCKLSWREGRSKTDFFIFCKILKKYDHKTQDNIEMYFQPISGSKSQLAKPNVNKLFRVLSSNCFGVHFKPAANTLIVSKFITNIL